MQNWNYTNLRHEGSPAINEARVSSSQLMSELYADFVRPTCNPGLGKQTKLVGGDRSEEKI